MCPVAVGCQTWFSPVFYTAMLGNVLTEFNHIRPQECYVVGNLLREGAR